MGMSRKIYRICLLSVVVIAIVGGILYYLNYVKPEPDITDGTLVWMKETTTEECGENL